MEVETTLKTLDGNEEEFIEMMKNHILDESFLKNLLNNPTDQNYSNGKSKTTKILLYFIYKTFLSGMNDAEKEISKAQKYFEGYAEEPEIQLSTVEDQVPEDAIEWYEQYAIYLTAIFERDILNEVQNLVQEYIEQGVNVRDIPSKLAQSEKLQGFTENRLNNIARTESTKAYNSGRVAQYANSKITEAVQYSAILDNRTTALCRGLHGKIMAKDSYLVSMYQPPNHYMCRSLLVPITKYEEWSQSDFSNVGEPQDGFNNPAWMPLKPLN